MDDLYRQFVFLGDVLTFALVPLFLYLLPTIVAAKRKHVNAFPIFLLNFLLGWTVLGWCGALIWAFTAQADREPAK